MVTIQSSKNVDTPSGGTVTSGPQETVTCLASGLPGFLFDRESCGKTEIVGRVDLRTVHDNDTFIDLHCGSYAARYILRVQGESVEVWQYSRIDQPALRFPIDTLNNPPFSHLLRNGIFADRVGIEVGRPLCFPYFETRLENGLPRVFARPNGDLLVTPKTIHVIKGCFQFSAEVCVDVASLDWSQLKSIANEGEVLRMG